MEHLAIGAARAGRSLEQIDRPQLVVCSLDEDRDLALDRARELLTQYLGQQPHIMKASGVDPALIAEIGKELTWPAGPDEIRKAMRLVPDDAVQMITAAGTPEECRKKVEEYIDAGATCPILYPLGDDVRLMIDTFGTRRRRRGASGAQGGVFTMRSFKGRDILSLKDFERDEYFEIFRVADELAPYAEQRENGDVFATKTLLTAFYQPSTRTRSRPRPRCTASAGMSSGSPTRR